MTLCLFSTVGAMYTGLSVEKMCSNLADDGYTHVDFLNMKVDEVMQEFEKEAGTDDWGDETEAFKKGTIFSSVQIYYNKRLKFIQINEDNCFQLGGDANTNTNIKTIKYNKTKIFFQNGEGETILAVVSLTVDESKNAMRLVNVLKAIKDEDAITMTAICSCEGCGQEVSGHSLCKQHLEEERETKKAEFAKRIQDFESKYDQCRKKAADKKRAKIAADIARRKREEEKRLREEEKRREADRIVRKKARKQRREKAVDERMLKARQPEYIKKGLELQIQETKEQMKDCPGYFNETLYRKGVCIKYEKVEVRVKDKFGEWYWGLGTYLTSNHKGRTRTYISKNKDKVLIFRNNYYWWVHVDNVEKKRKGHNGKWYRTYPEELRTTIEPNQKSILKVIYAEEAHEFAKKYCNKHLTIAQFRARVNELKSKESDEEVRRAKIHKLIRFELNYFRFMTDAPSASKSVKNNWTGDVGVNWFFDDKLYGLLTVDRVEKCFEETQIHAETIQTPEPVTTAVDYDDAVDTN